MGDDQVSHLHPDAALAAPRTSLGYADVTALVGAIETAQGPAALRRVAVVLSDIYQHGRRPRRARLPVAAILDIPFDSALAAAGPVPGPDGLGRHTKVAIERWIDLTAGALAH